MLGPLIRRQYKQLITKQTHELARNLLRRYPALGNLSPRMTPPRQKKPIGAHTDAQGLGPITAVVFVNDRVVAALHLPHWFCDRAKETEGGPPIFLFEL